MIYTVKTICEIIEGRFLQFNQNTSIQHIILDSRQTITFNNELFFALQGPRRNGLQFIPELFKKGTRNFVIDDENFDVKIYPEANFVLVKNVLHALHLLAAHHRRQFAIPIIGITGSNGKTIVKEWLYQLLHNDEQIVRNPKSYNSQIGVPLSIWHINDHHTLGIFEAGISLPGEMGKLEGIIQPSIGLFTNVGEAHNEGFESLQQKAIEKLKLFKNVDVLIYSSDHPIVQQAIADWIDKRKKSGGSPLTIFNWGHAPLSNLIINAITKQPSSTRIEAAFKSKKVFIDIPFSDDASIENAISCWCVLLYLGYDESIIRHRMNNLVPVNMRLEFRKGINQCVLINDSYSADLSSLKIALNYLQQQGASDKRVILSDFLQTGYKDDALYKEISFLLKQHQVNKIIGIGPAISKWLPMYKANNNLSEIIFYTSVDEFKHHFRSSQFHKETILIKGARIFQFEQIVKLLEKKVHQTVLEINLNALVFNLKQFQHSLKSSTKIMAMVKAFAYGSGGAEIAGALQFHKIDYLGVAYADEAVELRVAGIQLPIMVMNTEAGNFDVIIANNLEPVIYSFHLLQAFLHYLEAQGIQQYPVHIEIETGMHRLGFAEAEWTMLGEKLSGSPLKIQSVFSHLAAGEDPSEDVFTLQQYELLNNACAVLQKHLTYNFIKHISNSAAILRHPELQLDMVRLGIGLYGINTTGDKKLQLQPVATLKSTIAQIKKVKAGETISYNRKGIIKTDAVIATIRIGYADGYSRLLGNGKGYMLVHGKKAPVIGTVCMDMTMVDITGIKGVEAGDEVIVFGKDLPVVQLAEWVNTIPYEIMTGISERVQRVYFEE